MTDWTRRIIAVVSLVVLLTVLAACGNSSPEKSSPENSSSEKQEVTQETENDKPSNGTRIVQDEFGQVTIPAHPKRVAAIYLEDYLKALGVTPIVQWYNPTWGKQDYLELEVPLFDITGSIEALLEQEPDLIIVDGGVDQAKYEQYSKIAPTYRLPESTLQSSESILTTIADVLGIPEQATSVLTSYNDKVKDAKAKLEQSIGKQTVAVIRINTGDKTVALFGIKNRFVGEIYAKFGLEPHPLVANMENFQEILSEEGFPTLDADHIIVLPSNGSWDSAENQEAFKILDSSLWKTVPAFANGHVYKVERSHWQTGALSANVMKLDDILNLMAN
jgi:iron complex transport system substrate-binding protein